MHGVDGPGPLLPLKLKPGIDWQQAIYGFGFSLAALFDLPFSSTGSTYGSSCVYIENHPEVTLASATFDKNGGTDVVLAIKPYGAACVDIYKGMTALTAGTECKMSGNTVMLSASYLHDQSLRNTRSISAWQQRQPHKCLCLVEASLWKQQAQ